MDALKNFNCCEDYIINVLEFIGGKCSDTCKTILVTKLKIEVQNSFEETQILFDSLMQEYIE